MNVNLERPLIVVAARDERTMRTLAPEYWEGVSVLKPSSVFVTGADAYYIALQADAEVDEQLQNPYVAAYASYSSLVIQRSLNGRLPLWLQNGLAAVLSHTIVKPREVEFGKPQPWIAERAKAGPRLPLDQLFAVDRSSPNYRNGSPRELYDAQTWSLVQFLIFGYGQDAGARFDQLLAKVTSGVPSEQALTQTYGSLEDLQTAWLLYLHQGVFRYGRLPTNTAIIENKLPSRPATEAEQLAVRAALLVSTNRPVEATAHTRRVADGRARIGRGRSHRGHAARPQPGDGSGPGAVCEGRRRRVHQLLDLLPARHSACDRSDFSRRPRRHPAVARTGHHAQSAIRASVELPGLPPGQRGPNGPGGRVRGARRDTRTRHRQLLRRPGAAAHLGLTTR